MERSNAVLYGKGVFTTIAILGGTPFLWEKHWRRLARNAKNLGIDLSNLTENDVRASLKLQIEQHELFDGRARIDLRDASASTFWAEDSERRTEISLLFGPERTSPKSFRLTLSPFQVNSSSPLSGVKSCNYLEQILSLDEAKGRGFHEAVRVNERGHVTSGCMSNIFWLKNGRLYTPTLTTGCLAGTTREYVLENIECEEVEAEIGDLESADAIYLTSAGLGIVRVAEYNGRELADTSHPIQTLWPPS